MALHEASANEVDSYDPPSPNDLTIGIESLVGPGSMIFSRHAFESTGGMDENYSGWGWEDIDFAERLSA
ncbi:MAG: galactosyltransferase-related protein, partial [Verrucomicrobiales bacterium]|nr:galactosyltransferase-related protein [Verrucomicrobiales bacterium]